MIAQYRGFLGIGLTQETASNDAYLKACLANMSNDTEGRFTDLAEKYKVWTPTSNMLHFSGVGAFKLISGTIINVSTFKKVNLANTKLSVPAILYLLLDKLDVLPYDEQLVCCVKRFEEFLADNGVQYIPVSDLPTILISSLMSNTEETFPSVVYTYADANIVASVDSVSVYTDDSGEDAFRSSVSAINNIFNECASMLYKENIKL